ncbi:MAG: hypothetical protein KJS79_06910 [Rhodospirillales bacterium]|nr:hypothetical protein [Rhodospirillales bacterium]
MIDGNNKGGAKAPPQYDLQDQRATALSEAIRQLRPIGQLLEWDVKGAVHDLMISIPSERPFRSSPRGIGNSTREQAIAEMEAVNKAARALLEALDNIHEPAWQAISCHMKYDWLSKTKANILVMEIASRNTPEKLQEIRVAFLEKPSKKTKNDRMHDFSMKTAMWYEHFSGKSATISTDPETGAKYSEYIDFMRVIFQIIGIKNPPRHWAEVGRNLLREHRAKAAEAYEQQVKQFIERQKAK